MPPRLTRAAKAVVLALAIVGAMPAASGVTSMLSPETQDARWRADERKARADLLLHGWRFAPAETVLTEVPSSRACEPNWVAPRTTDLDFSIAGAERFRAVQGPDVSACPDATMSVSYNFALQTPYGEGLVDVARMRWDRPVFPVDAPHDRFRATRVGGAPAVVIEPLDVTGLGPSQVIVIRDGSFEPYAELLVLSGTNVPSSLLLNLAEQVRPGAAIRARLPDLLNLGPAESAVRILPPASHGDGAVRAKLTDDWHCSRVSGDACPRGRTHSCTPGAYGRSSCSALDWNRGSPVIGENVYFRSLGTATRGRVVRARPTSYTQTCHVVQVQIVDGGDAIGSLRYQHISRRAESFDVALGDGTDAYTEKLIGETLNEARLAPGCPWNGSHVHEDDTSARAWVAWNEARYTDRERTRFAVRDAANWTRMMRWSSGR